MLYRRGGFDRLKPIDILLVFGEEERQIWSATADTKKLELEGRNSQKGSQPAASTLACTRGGRGAGLTASLAAAACTHQGAARD
jgi:hypothetical protein